MRKGETGGIEMKKKRKNKSTVAPVALPFNKQLNKNGEEVQLYNGPRMFRIEDAFSWDSSDESIETRELNVERCIRSVAFLLEYLAQGINPISEWATLGLASCLDFCADEAASAQRSRKIEEQFLLDIREPADVKTIKKHLSDAR
jgi:hypothetical protein